MPPLVSANLHRPFTPTLQLQKLYAGDQSHHLAHRATEDDWCEGMYIPKGTFCIPNVWHLNRDSEIFGKNTDDFDPARYLDASGDKGDNALGWLLCERFCRCPKPFECEITPRFPEAPAMLAQELELRGLIEWGGIAGARFVPELPQKRYRREEGNAALLGKEKGDQLLFRDPRNQRNKLG
ncbi:hypothetical protein F5888DRAFT_1630262 [Russula emetica]|nr:hypothetical protein F5888DRAFT_1630262 [Russula emetica]